MKKLKKQKHKRQISTQNNGRWNKDGKAKAYEANFYTKQWKITSWAEQSHTWDFLWIYPNISPSYSKRFHFFFIFWCCLPLEVIFIWSICKLWFGHLSLSIEFEYDTISGCWDIILLIFWGRLHLKHLEALVWSSIEGRLHLKHL